MWSRIKRQPAVGKAVAYYDHLPARDRQALLVLAVALLLALLYFIVWRPAAGFHERTLNERENAQELLAWMQSNQEAIEALNPANNTGAGNSDVEKPVDGRALMALITRTADEADLALQRFEPGDENTVRVWMDSVPYTRVAGWLEMLANRHGVIIDQASMDRAETPGIISVRLTLTI